MTWEWEQFKERIRELYINQKKPLDKVIQILRNECGFMAKKRAYQKKLREWKFSKNAHRNPRMLHPVPPLPGRQRAGPILVRSTKTSVPLVSRSGCEVRQRVSPSSTCTSPPGCSGLPAGDTSFGGFTEGPVDAMDEDTSLVITDLDLHPSDDHLVGLGIDIVLPSPAEENCVAIATNIFRNDCLTRKTPCPEASLITDLVIKLKLHDLAIQVAIAYITIHEISIPEYIDLQREISGEVIQQLGETVGEENQTLFTTAEVSLRQLSDGHRRFLLFCSFLDCEKIPLELLRRFFNSSQTGLNEYVLKLLQYKLASQEPSSKNISLSPSLHRWLQKRLPSRKHLINAEREAIVKMSDSIFLDCTSSKEDWEFAKLVIPHLEAVIVLILRNKDLVSFWDKDLLKAAAGIAEVARRLHIGDKVILVLKHIHNLMEYVFGTRGPETLNALNSLSVTYISIKNWVEAEALLRDLVSSRRNSTNRDELCYITELVNLMRVLINRGHLEEAKVLHISVSDCAKWVVPKDRAEAMRVEIKLGESFRLCGYLMQAQAHFLKLQKETEDVLGKSHPSTLRVLELLCHVFLDNKSWVQAERLGHELAERSEAVLGKTQIDTLRRKRFLERVGQARSELGV